MTLKYRELKRRYELDGADQTVSHLSEALREGHLKPEDFSIRDLAEGASGCCFNHPISFSRGRQRRRHRRRR
jgi:hypothetical protein